MRRTGRLVTLSLTETWRAGRAERVTRPARPAVLTTIVKYAARKLPRWRQIRTAAMSAAGFGFVDYAVYGWNHLAGWAAVGVSLLLLEVLGKDKR